jgi:hypothetical protein
MKVFVGVIIALVVGFLVFQLTKKKDTPIDLNSLPQSMVTGMPSAAAAEHNVSVEEVIQATAYTYMRVKEKKVEYWIATAKMDMAVGSKYSFGNALEMTNFTSKELNRTFDRILFVSEGGDQAGGQQSNAAPLTTMGRPKVELKNDVVIPPTQGGISIAELYKNRDQYANKKVKVKGKVVKVNPEVMGKNWVHLQDGTKDGGNFDLTITTLETAAVDEIIEFEGTIVLNKDFGAGYVYELIMEGGLIRK